MAILARPPDEDDHHPFFTLDGVVLDAYQLHLEELIRAEVIADLDRIEEASWEPVRQHLVRVRRARSWPALVATHKVPQPDPDMDWYAGGPPSYSKEQAA